MRTLNPFSIHQGTPVKLMEGRTTMLMLLLFVLLATTTVIQAVPTRMFNSANSKLTGATGPATAAGSPVIPEEELELESLKGSSQQSQRNPLSLSGAGVANKKSSSSATTPEDLTTVKPIAYVKKPENEETPALSDNANSLKYGGANAELEEALANMAHIPPSKSPSLSVKPSSGVSSPLGDSILQQKRTKQGGMGLLSKAGGTNLEVDYTPQDIAEYIFWMGDERGVELAINDFIQEGLITPQDAVRFLEDVKAELNSLRNRYASTVSLGRAPASSPLGATGSSGSQDSTLGFWDYPVHGLSKKQSSPPAAASSSFINNNIPGSGYPSSSSSSSFSSASSEQINPYYFPTGSRSFLSKSNYLNGAKDSSSSFSSSLGNSPGGTSSLEDILDYEEIVEKLRQADTRMREIALEGIIYQLARELFTTGLQQSPGTSVPKFTSFIESLAVNGNISKDLERSVLETLVQALVDAANERGLLIAKSNEGQDGTSNKIGITFSKSSGGSGGGGGAAAGLSGLGTSQTNPILLKKKSV